MYRLSDPERGLQRAYLPGTRDLCRAPAALASTRILQAPCSATVMRQRQIRALIIKSVVFYLIITRYQGWYRGISAPDTALPAGLRRPRGAGGGVHGDVPYKYLPELVACLPTLSRHSNTPSPLAACTTNRHATRRSR